MNESPATKIASLAEERGLSQEEFARIAGVSRLTAGNIFHRSPRRLHNATVAKCARALGLTVHDLRVVPLEDLLRRPRAVETPGSDGRRYEEATQPELLAWLARHPERAGKLSSQEMDELLSLQGTGGPMTAEGVDHFVAQVERKRRLMEKMAAIAGTEYVDLLEQFVDLLHEKIRPYRDRK